MTDGVAMDDHERWQTWREQTPAMGEYAYMNSGFAGPERLAVHEAIRRRLDLELVHGSTTRRALDDRYDLALRYRELMGRLLGGASPDEIAITGNTSEGINIVTNGLDVESGDCVVTTGVEHGSGIVPAYYLRQRSGCELVIVPIDAQDSPGAAMESFVTALDGAGSSLKLVILSEISYSTGQLLPLKAMVEETHRRGGHMLVDGAQTAGHIPIDVRESGVDFYAIPSHKWLCGPDGFGALYVRRGSDSARFALQGVRTRGGGVRPRGRLRARAREDHEVRADDDRDGADRGHDRGRRVVPRLRAGRSLRAGARAQSLRGAALRTDRGA